MQEISIDIHTDIRIQVGSIGVEKQPIILVDNFVNEPEVLVDFAASKLTLRSSADYYPGIRADSPAAYMNLIQASLGELICQIFNIEQRSVIDAGSYFSVVVTPPEKLLPVQRIPHIDGANPNDIAFLHYLCNEKYGGTSFYRHKSTGHEYVNQQRYEPYIATLEEEIKKVGLPEPPQYMNGDTALFERITSIEAKFNRLIIYRGTSLHSGNIDEFYNFNSDPKAGRLTLTSFLYSKT